MTKTQNSGSDSALTPLEGDAPVILESVLTCPHCGRQSRKVMPTDACLFFWDCPGCGVRLKPMPGHCCVFCSYGSVKCPPIQAGSGCPPCKCGS